MTIKNKIYNINPLYKILIFTLNSIFLFKYPKFYFVIPNLIVLILLCILSKINIKEVVTKILQFLFFLVFIFVINLFTYSFDKCIIIVLKLLTIYLFSYFIILTTDRNVLLKKIEKLIEPISKVGINHKKITLCINLSLRFIPIIKKIYYEVQNAQKARGLKKNIFNLAIPIIIRIIKMAENISDAIEARSPN